MISRVLSYLTIWLLSVYQCKAITYAIHRESCVGDMSLDLAMEEVQKMADKAWNKLNTDDGLITQAFDLIFQTPASDTDSKSVVLGKVSAMSSTLNSDLLIHRQKIYRRLPP